jgi:hypothetical protein
VFGILRIISYLCDMEEIWKDIKQLNNKYSVSNLGRIKNNKTGYILKPIVDNRGYQMLWVNHKGYQYHRLVLSNFNPILNWENLHVNHIDCNPLNNQLTNLEWVTVQENNVRKKVSKFPKSRKILKRLFSKYTDNELFELLKSI